MTALRASDTFVHRRYQGRYVSEKSSTVTVAHNSRRKAGAKAMVAGRSNISTAALFWRLESTSLAKPALTVCEFHEIDYNE